MEKVMDCEQKILMKELTQGKELARQLMNHLNPSSSIETRQFLIEKILFSYEKALSMLSSDASNFLAEPKPTTNFTMLELPQSFPNSSSSPKSCVSDQDCKDQSPRSNVFKKRKTLPRWSEQVRVCSGTGLDGPLNDGYSWRKYGQKDILGAHFPRGYYRCTHRHNQGCLATKQVQRSDEDPTIFEVTYRGKHTCTQSSHLAIINDNNKSKDLCQQQQEEEEIKLRSSEEEEALQVKTEDLDTCRDQMIFPSFSFPPCSASIAGAELPDQENNIFTECILENNFLGSNISPPTFIISPSTTSESNYFSNCHMSNNYYGGGIIIGQQNVQTPESGLTDIISAPTSVTNSPSPIGDFDISTDVADFDTSFSLDNLEFFT